MKKRSAYKWKVPVVSLLVNLVVMLLVFLPQICFVGGHVGLTENLIDEMGPGSVGGGWLILPAMLGDFGIAMVAVFFGAILIMYSIAAAVITIWNVIWNCCNKKEKKWMLLASLIPAGIVAVVFLVCAIRLFIDISYFETFLFVVPALIMLASQIWQYKLFMKVEETEAEVSQVDVDGDYI